MFRFIVLLSAVLVAVRAQSTSVSRCTGNPGELPINTYIDGCGTPPCILHQLEHTSINVAFRAPRNIRSMTTLATAYLSIGFITIPIAYDLQEQADTCQFLTNTRCPVSQGELVNYTLRMYIEPFFPVGTSVSIEFRVVDQDSSPVFCLRTPIRIAAPRNGRLAALAAGY